MDGVLLCLPCGTGKLGCAGVIFAISGEVSFLPDTFACPAVANLQ